MRVRSLLQKALARSEERPDRGEVRGHHSRVWTVGELRIAGDMIAMPVRVRDDQLVRGSRVLGQPALEQAVHGVTQGKPVRVRRRARVE